MIACDTSGKSTQKAFIFSPYKKLAKLSLKRDILSFIICNSLKLDSRVAMLSESSANWFSSAESGNTSSGRVCDDARNEPLDERRSGVVGRDCGPRELERRCGPDEDAFGVVLDAISVGCWL